MTSLSSTSSDTSTAQSYLSHTMYRGHVHIALNAERRVRAAWTSRCPAQSTSVCLTRLFAEGGNSRYPVVCRVKIHHSTLPVGFGVVEANKHVRSSSASASPACQPSRKLWTDRQCMRKWRAVGCRRGVPRCSPADGIHELLHASAVGGLAAAGRTHHDLAPHHVVHRGDGRRGVAGCRQRRARSLQTLYWRLAVRQLAVGALLIMERVIASLRYGMALIQRRRRQQHAGSNTRAPPAVPGSGPGSALCYLETVLSLQLRLTLTLTLCANRRPERRAVVRRRSNLVGRDLYSFMIFERRRFLHKHTASVRPDSDIRKRDIILRRVCHRLLINRHCR